MPFELQYLTLGSDNAPYVLVKIEIAASHVEEALERAVGLPWPEEAVRSRLIDETGREIASHTRSFETAPREPSD